YNSNAMIGIDDFVAYVEIAIAHHEGTPTSAGEPTALNYFILSCRERQFLGWTPQPWQARLRSMQSGASPLATGCCSRHAPVESSCHADYRAARHSVQIQRSWITFGLTDGRH